MTKCIVDDCSKSANARGMCHTHYMQQRRAGNLPIGTRARGTLEERFWRYVKKTDSCWIWTGKCVSKKGYGRVALGGAGAKLVLVHRLSYIIHKGEIPQGNVVMHTCDNPSCVNPDHLKAGTQSENIIDAISKGRKTIPKLPLIYGENHHSSRLTESDVIFIRNNKNLSYKEIAKKLNVYPSSVRRAALGITWKHL